MIFPIRLFIETSDRKINDIIFYNDSDKNVTLFMLAQELQKEWVLPFSSIAAIQSALETCVFNYIEIYNSIHLYRGKRKIVENKVYSFYFNYLLFICLFIYKHIYLFI